MPPTPDVFELGESLLAERLASITDAREIGWVLVHGDKVVTSPGAQRRFRIASMTKSFTAAVVLSVVRDYQQFTVETMLREIIPELSSDLSSATVGHALSMTTGLPTDDAWADRLESMSKDEFLELIAQPLITNQPAGANYEYANLGYALLGLVLERVTEKSFAQLLDEYLLEPLELSDTSLVATGDIVQGYHPRRNGTLTLVQPTSPGAFSAIGGLWSTPENIGRWISHLRNARYRYLEGQPLARTQQVLAALQDPKAFYRVYLSGDSVAYQAYGYGLHYLWDAELGEFSFHSGGYPGFGSHMRWHTATGVGIGLMGNRTYFSAEDIVQPILETLVTEFGYQAHPVREKASSVTTFTEPAGKTRANLEAFQTLMQEWNPDLAYRILSPNVLLDYTESELIEMIADFRQRNLHFAQWLSRTEAIFVPSDGHSQLQVLFNPLGQIQKVTWLDEGYKTSQRPPSYRD